MNESSNTPESTNDVNITVDGTHYPNGYPYAPPRSVPCRSCGYCPTCGRVNPPTPPVYPWWNGNVWTVKLGANSANNPNTITFNNPTANATATVPYGAIIPASSLGGEPYQQRYNGDGG